ncbi:peptidase domain-containing ABC transporter [Nodularia spumigena CS-584]|jgi:ATP-binding cassette, subfamily B, bacterial HlyB/CyaB|uniref:Leukotoxin export ATP-binding protein LtxB n=3 Tax=Nodularia spumigena TaxID=70799 RepID=A0A2S0Q5I0_NODSP|nr:peptidase domain-containing ABC transporter [Nodularia spumigena]AHJ26992.1 toxin secretion ABC transporter ATP-binding protein [Nodularia spumigena CCY9414]AVZ29628.1 leukotoxin export ATP-binding protein LtxB [Nodularia spumigena UHCC 0039]EAW44487.1 toxin secretion ABC transporter ATP-binding protein [Nodularia spumigena CCY9414]MDB9384277.1 peptidase domain-containing ABC transporter [Nodularia spumigena CS-584]MEA5555761.1 peptidase domain-containing ABC transporter [Nodularia spumigen
MTYITSSFQEFIPNLEGFEHLPSEEITHLSKQLQPLRYRIGQKIIGKDKLPEQITILYEGKVRLLGYHPQTQTPTTLKLLQPGAIIGEISILREVACETAIASTEVICLSLSKTEYLRLLASYPDFANIRLNRTHLIEIFDVLSSQVQKQANAVLNLTELVQQALSKAKIHYLNPGITPVIQLDSENIWFVSGGGSVTNFPPGSRLQLTDTLAVNSTNRVRLIGLSPADLSFLDSHQAQVPINNTQPTITNHQDIPYAYDQEIPQPEPSPEKDRQKYQNYPFVSGKGELNSISACFQMLSKHLEMPFRKEVIRRILTEQIKRQGNISFPACAYIAELIGLKSQLIDLPVAAITRIPTPALIYYGDSYAVLYETNPNTIVAGVPSQGIVRCKPAEFVAKLDVDESNLPPQVKVLLLAATKETPQERFGLQWFIPYLSKHRQVLIEVFIASFFVQLAQLANPLVIQLIIDKVIVQNSISTLNILGVLLLVVGIFEALLTTLRTYLFVDTTNRIDMGLGSQIIDHLLRLPLRYFERRPVGELATRINELENIRQFLTGTALTVVLDAVFSIIYIVVMLFYSWQLTLVGLSTIPVFIIITLIFSPTIRKQLRTKAERNAQTQSYLVEVMSGIQTVKAQNIELQSRFSWQERYARYVTSGFKNVITSTLANSTSSFLNKLSALLILWLGAYLVLQGELTLGELIAFRIISGYVTSPILRLAQLWQTFQETALSLERLSDIVDTPQEGEEDRDNIPLPAISGNVKFENVSFRFATSGPFQLTNVNLEIPSGKFIGIVGQSGSGKSTLMKLLLRLYEVESGRILIDNYDISKVELYSLRRQVGVVPQETLLFDGTVQENIALTNPDSTTDEIIEAARIAVAHDFIMSLPNGYNTRVGERGAGLSGGQRQRIAIARSILQRPKLLVLDEATSALDYPTERQVCLNLAKAFEGNTVFFITHRLNTVSHADMIVVMDNSRVIEQGSHKELIAAKGHYSYLYQQQEVNL